MLFLTVYIDVLFFINFIINFLVLYLTGKISRLPRPPWRLILGAAMGAVYALCMFFPRFSFAFGAAAKVLFSLGVVAATFRIHGIRLYLKTVAVFYMVTFALGGSVMALFYFTNMGAALGAVVKNGIFYINLPWEVLLLTVFIAYEIIRLGWGVLQSKLSKDTLYRKVGISFCGEEVWVDALLDTGNSLCDPFSGTPVIVAEYDVLRPILPPELGIGEESLVSIERIQDVKLRAKLRMIPFTSLGKEHGMLVGFMPDKAWILENENLRETGEIVVAIYTRHLSRDQSYGALLPPQLAVQ